jgi:hypothetical protein
VVRFSRLLEDSSLYGAKIAVFSELNKEFGEYFQNNVPLQRNSAIKRTLHSLSAIIPNQK